MNLLNNTKCYLIGPIEQSADPVGWRNKITAELNKLGVKVYDPMKKPYWAPKVTVANKGSFLDALNNNKEYTQQDKDAFEGMRWIRTIDKRFVNDADFVVCFLPKTFSVGSCEELSICANSGKPVLIWSDKDLIPSSWLADMLCKDIEEIRETFFKSSDAVMDYLNKVNNNEIPLDPFKWVFLTYFNNNIKIKYARNHN